MQTTNIACPACRQSLKLTQALPPGTRVRCTGCGQLFDLPSITTAPASAVSPSMPGPSLQPLPPPTSGFALGLLFGVVVMLGAAGVGAVVYMNRDKNPPADNRTAANDTRSSDKDGAPETTKPGPQETNGTKPPPETVVRPDRSNPVKPPEPMPDPTPPAPDPTPKPKPKPLPDQKPFETHLDPALQKKVDAAIDRGVAFLKSRQGADGSWDDVSVRMAALPALTLLECGVPADDDKVAKAVALVRAKARSLTNTYELSLIILLLDRLNDPADVPLIQTLAMRLMGGQCNCGGWRYECVNGPPAAKEKDFLRALVLTRPKDNLELFAGADGRLNPVWLGIRREFLPTTKFDPDAPFQNDEARRVIDSLPAPCKTIPALIAPSKLPPPPEERVRPDNSNTQFAALALLAAARHDVPVGRALALIARRFRTTQDARGGWAYFPGGPLAIDITPSMTCSGLLGLAAGRGLLTDVNIGANYMRLQNDAAIQRALRWLGPRIERPFDEPGGKKTNLDPDAVSLYFLWSLERVGVIFNLPKIAGRDWYLGAVARLLPTQRRDGAWFLNNYTGSTDVIDTCLSLLILKRANLAKELTVKINKLELIAEDKDKDKK